MKPFQPASKNLPLSSLDARTSLSVKKSRRVILNPSPSKSTGPDSVDMNEVKESFLSLHSLEFAETYDISEYRSCAAGGFWLSKSSGLDIKSSSFTVLGLSATAGIDPPRELWRLELLE
ncbi:hypothetical protein OIU77_018720 [Salix suchowensis]|uniref:Uncharacterized protein n=1 Tax=Salix suchowensis TaxID=1278906 RepID=A0ABQ9CHN6_9ROSI|nr:hypothetical protein OIU77_018720 [Salix suchowensis]